MDRPMTDPEASDPTAPARNADAPLSTLRGAGVDIDVRVVGRVVVILCLVALAALVIIFTLAGVHKNSQINRLRHNGVPVDVTVVRCLGLLGGSGSNAAGYSCTGTFSLDGSRHNETIPGIGFRTPGSSLRAVAVPGDPALLSPVDVLAGEHVSWGVYLLPAVLLVVLALFIVAIIVRRRRTPTPPAKP
jgi:hypothetical protein